MVSQNRSHTDPLAEPEAVVSELLNFLEEQTRSPWEPETDLYRDGGLSSLFAMQLVVHLEKSYDIAIRGADLRLDNFRTVRLMSALVCRLQQAQADGRDG
ncbi:acyl carrier protein [Streptacidiphilus sp. P02-A3a]|uniref:acyl carrier protein n=1 Tax=Streptacidiphilus sp. P02-A3a TaxID=2704468 RepID=UPI0015FA31D0|nr:acyl carrier protein [Streptacidiphilus sp. P02-A3a]QMU70748.1 acyl carrier protein [Streptacidiphilus sp. P02-A3a]